MVTTKSSHCTIHEPLADDSTLSTNSKEDNSYTSHLWTKLMHDAGPSSKSLQRVSSVGLGIVERQKRQGFKGPPKSITLPPPPIIRFDSGTPKDTTTTTFPVPRRILPLPSPSYVGDQPAFTKHDIISPFIPCESASTSTPSLTPPILDDTAIPVISLSPSFPAQPLRRMPNLTELPMLGDVDDDHFEDHGSLSVPPLMAEPVITREQPSLLSPAIRQYDETTLIGKTIWKFRINRLLGLGAFSKVYLATSEESDKKKSAIKMIRKSKMLKDLRMKSSIEREVAVLQFLQHPGVIQLEATMEIEQHMCLVLEYVDGGELFDFVQQQGMLDSAGKVDESMVKGLFLQLATVVQWMHEQNVVHRDLKLENILLYRDNGTLKLKLSDFGLARVIDPQQPMLTTRCGSEEYVAPEIVQGLGYDGRLTDTWALGVILFSMLVGYLPFSARDGVSLSQVFYQIMQACVRWPKDQAISDHAKQVAESLLQRQPHKRIPLVDVPSLPWFQR